MPLSRQFGLLLALAPFACESGAAPEAERCGPSSATVEQVIDGDTIMLSSGEKVRYLLVDAPEITNGHNDCYGQDAYQYRAAEFESLELGARQALRGMWGLCPDVACD